MHLVVRRFTSGERVPMLLDEHGIPLYWPTLFSTVRLRNAGLAVNSIKNKLSDLKVLLLWQHLHGRSLESEFAAGTFLSLADVVSIRDFAARKIADIKATRSGKTRSDRILEAHLAPVPTSTRVTKHVHYNRLTTIADYVEFLAETLTARRGDTDIAAAIGRMAKQVRQNRPRGMASNGDDDPNELSPPTVWVDEFLRVGSEGHPENPFRKGAIQRRNELMFRLLYETGIRIGELLSLRLDSIELGHHPTVTVRRTHDDRYDPRPYQPVAKTKERTLPISDDVATKLRDYYMKDRATTPGATRHPYVFVTHRRGRTCGQPLSMSAASNRVFGAMQAVRPEFSGFHAHSFRHHLNYLLSKAVDKHNRRARRRENRTGEEISSGRERSSRAYMNGHRRSDSSNDYNQRALRERTNRRVLEIQEIQTENAKRGRSNDD